MADLDNKERTYIGLAFKGIIFFAVLGMIAVLIGANMISSVFANMFK